MSTPIDLDDKRIEKFWSLVDKSEACWQWKGYHNLEGYGAMEVLGKKITAHRIAYTLTYGSIPDGVVIDHLCRVRDCVNPAHLELVTNRENILRGKSFSAINRTKTHCSKGHPFDEQNTGWRAHKTYTQRYCITCNTESLKALKQRKAIAQ